jgi:hypothetical protein
MRSGIRLALVLGALAFGASSAHAFEETRGGGAPQGVNPSKQVAPGVSLDLGGPIAPGTPSVGTEVRIPGLGKLGILPKLDFGLELLYGVNEKSLDERHLLPPDQKDDGVGIRGTLRHRF